MFKKCRVCKIDKTFDNYSKKAKRKDGIQSDCKDCRKVYIRQHYKENKQYYIDKARISKENNRKFIRSLKNKPCSDCGQSYPHYVMDFDHLRDKEFNIADMVKQCSYDKLVKELEKCELVCSNCHRARTWKRKHPELGSNQQPQD